MDRDPNFLERFWGMLLSRQAALIQKAFSQISIEEQQAVIAHLKQMATEDGWQPEQRSSAQTALDVLEKPPAG